jgi:RNA recognition motif-containing protein
MAFKKLFVGSLPFVYSDDELRALFAGCGTVLSAAMVYDPDRDRTRGFGFVEMSTPEEALGAIAKLNGTPVGERKIFVTEAREKKPSDPNKTPRENRFAGPRARKVGRNQAPKPRSSSYPPNPYEIPMTRPFDPNRRPPQGSEPRRPFGRGPERSEDRRPFGRPPGPADRFPKNRFSKPGFGDSRGRKPYRAPEDRVPGAFGRPTQTGPGRSSPWRPRTEGKGSFSAPRNDRGDFGPSNRKPKDLKGKPGKKVFWKKFEKKK